MKHIVLLSLGAAALMACSLVDEETRDCQNDYDLDYELQLVTNLTTELQTQLSLATDLSVSSALKAEMQAVFTDFAHDVDLSFYDVKGDSLRLHHETHVMDASESSYALNIPVRKYMHLAVANVVDNPMVQLTEGEKCHEAAFSQVVRDTVESHSTGLFSARLLMDVQEGVDQQFNVGLYMVNCATSIVLDTLGSGIKDMKVFMTGFATGFNIADSTFVFGQSPIVRPVKVVVEDQVGAPLCFASVNFPSQDVSDTKVVIDTDEPFDSDSADHSLWEIKVYSTLPDGSVTETILDIFKPLRPGQFKIIRAKVRKDGAADPVTPSGEGDPTVGVSVVLDWDPGLVIDVPL